MRDAMRRDTPRDIPTLYKNSAPTDSRELSSRAMACQGFTGIACVMVIHYYLQFSFYYNTKIANQ